MAVPNSSVFSLQTVVNEINPPSNNLASCFANSNSSGFVSSYAGSKNRLSNFRGYSHSTSYSY